MTQHDQKNEKALVPRYIIRWLDDRLFIFDVTSDAFFELNTHAGHAFERLLAGDTHDTIATAAPPACRDACRAFLRQLMS